MNGNMVSPDMRAQVERSFANVARSLRAAGASGRDVIRVRMYVVGLDAEKHWPIVNEQMRKHFGDRGPTATLVGTQTVALRACFARTRDRAHSSQHVQQ